jgi:hypothetical protein
MSMQRIMEAFIIVESSRRRVSRRINQPRVSRRINHPRVLRRISQVPWKVMTLLNLQPLQIGIYVVSMYFHHHNPHIYKSRILVMVYAAKVCIHLCICMCACISMGCSVLNYSLLLSLYLTNFLFFLSHFCLAGPASLKKMAKKVSMYPKSLVPLKRLLIYRIVWFGSVVSF